MKVKHLMEILATFDSEIEVGVLHDNGIFLAQDLGIYKGTIKVPYGDKMILHNKQDRYVIIGNPGDYEIPAYHDNNTPIETYYVDNNDNIEKHNLKKE